MGLYADGTKDLITNKEKLHFFKKKATVRTKSRLK